MVYDIVFIITLLIAMSSEDPLVLIASGLFAIAGRVSDIADRK